MSEWGRMASCRLDKPASDMPDKRPGRMPSCPTSDNGNMPSLEGRVILITGAAKRIGRHIAICMARDGARVARHYHTSKADALRTAAECGAAPLFKANLERHAELETLF